MATWHSVLRFLLDIHRSSVRDGLGRRPVFIGIGLVSLAWLAAWWKWMPQGKADAGSAVTGAALIAAILRQRSFWGASAGHFCTNYLLYVMITWLPFYLVRERHLSIEAMAKTAGLYFLVEAAAAISCGWLSDSFIRRRYTPTLVRKSAMALGHTTESQPHEMAASRS